MMHRELGRLSLLSWFFLVAAICICYVAIVAGITGIVSAWTTSVIIFGAVMAGCVAALVYLISAMHDIRSAPRVH
jgi:hypothetical protein